MESTSAVRTLGELPAAPPAVQRDVPPGVPPAVKPSTAPRASARTATRRAPDLRANAALIAAATLALAYQLFGLPLLLRAAGGPSFALMATLVPVVLATPIHWGLIHEGIHGQLLRSRRANEIVARLLAIGMAMPFDAVRFGHLMHHRFTREAFDRPDVDDARGPRWLRRLAWYVRLLGGLYVGELLVPLLAFVPVRLAHALVARGVGTPGESASAEDMQVQRLFVNHATDPQKRRRARRDWLGSLALYACAFALYGKAWPVLVAAMFARGLWLSLADNLPHYGVALDEPGRSRDFRVPRVIGVLLMNHHLHRQHHLHPTLPWAALPVLANAEYADVDEHGDAAPAQMREPYWRAALRQLKGLQPGVGAGGAR
ncbi:Fatty acid desaturase [Paraburkholderia tropica]|uniref:fatty acid desaturase family protein n=1 Tax=Paraburkholderia tropica TaxID=92647 RepID=UPI001CB33A75|nr:fatty acid desaturase [Paraburkholderia tropica]CAG9218611.1 Fatty acid desaturase [Paraburkholderia tropica]